MRYKKRAHIFGSNESYKWNYTYVMLEEVISYKEVLTIWMTKEIRGLYFEERDWETTEMMLQFLKLFYLTITIFSNIYIPSSHTALHNIYEITKCFIKYRSHNDLKAIIVAL